MPNMYLCYAGGDPASAAIKFEGWMYYDPDLFLLED